MTQKIVLTISGMHCSSCAKIIETTLEDKPGVNSISVDYESKKAFLEFNQDNVGIEEIKDEIEALGYKAA